MTYEDTVALVKTCNALWPGSNLDVQQTAVNWRPLLAGFQLDAVVAAVHRMGGEADRRFAPRVGEIATAATPRTDRSVLARCDCRDPGCRCTACELGWVEYRDDQGRVFARPCSSCRPADAELMSAGHWACTNRKGCPTCKEILARRRPPAGVAR